MRFQKGKKVEMPGIETPSRALHRVRKELLRMELAIGSGPFDSALLPALQVWSAFAAGIPGGAFENGIHRARRMMELMLGEALPDGLDPRAREALRLGRLAGAMILGLLSGADDILDFEFRPLTNGTLHYAIPAFDPSQELLLEFLLQCAAKGEKVAALALSPFPALKRREKERAGLREFLLRKLIDRHIAALMRNAVDGGLEAGLRLAAIGFPGGDEEAKRLERILMKALSEECRKASLPGSKSSAAAPGLTKRPSSGDVRNSLPARFCSRCGRKGSFCSRVRTTARTLSKRKLKRSFLHESGLRRTGSSSSGPKGLSRWKPSSAHASGFRRKRVASGWLRASLRRAWRIPTGRAVRGKLRSLMRMPRFWGSVRRRHFSPRSLRPGGSFLRRRHRKFRALQGV